MLKLSEEQCASVDRMEDDDFVRDTAQKIKKRFPMINEPDETFHARLGTGVTKAELKGF